MGLIKGPWTWHLWTSDAAIRACDEIQIMRIRLSLQGEVGTVLPWPTLPKGPLVLRALTLRMQAALEDKNLGRWAEFMQERTSYLPFLNHPPLCMARRLSHVHRWLIALTPPRNVIYPVYNIWLQIVYVGLTTAALASRLRKHMTDSLAGVDCATLHKHMAKSKLSGWGILHLQWVARERAGTSLVVDFSSLCL